MCTGVGRAGALFGLYARARSRWIVDSRGRSRRLDYRLKEWETGSVAEEGTAYRAPTTGSS